MTPVLLITRDETSSGAALAPIYLVLQNLGIPYEVGYFNNDQLRLPTRRAFFQLPDQAGQVRALFRRFAAVAIFERAAATATETGYDGVLRHFLSWNDSSDAPVLYVGVRLNTARAPLLPADFPIIPIDPSSESSVLSSCAPVDGSLPAGNDLSGRGQLGAGGGLWFTTEKTVVYSRAYNHFWGSSNTQRIAHYLVQRNRLGTQAEILIAPFYPEGDPATPSKTLAAVAVRYKNRYFLPVVQTQWSANYARPSYDYPTSLVGLTPFLYGLQRAGVRPRYPAVLTLDLDHPVEARTTTPPLGLTEIDLWEGYRETLWWLYKFCHATGLAVQMGVRTGYRYFPSFQSGHWNLLHNTAIPAHVRERAWWMHQLLLRGHQEGVFPCTAHDHKTPPGSFNMSDQSDWIRHTGGAMGAPQIVPVAHGKVILREVAPEWIKQQEPHYPFTCNDLIYLDFSPRLSGTGQAINPIRHNSHWFAKMWVEFQMEEMRALGFSDCYGGEKSRYINPAHNALGGVHFARAYYEAGVRAHRCTSFIAEDRSFSRIHTYRADPRFWECEGIALIPAYPVDPVFWGSYSYGLFDSRTRDNGTGSPINQCIAVHWALDLTPGEISQLYMTDPQSALKKTYRRYLSAITDFWLSLALRHLGLVYIHPRAYIALDPRAPTAPALSGGWHGVYRQFNSEEGVMNHFNQVVEQLENMARLVRVLHHFLHFGSVADLREWRARVEASLR
jgi:hypothetical protein